MITSQIGHRFARKFSHAPKAKVRAQVERRLASIHEAVGPSVGVMWQFDYKELWVKHPVNAAVQTLGAWMAVLRHELRGHLRPGGTPARESVAALNRYQRAHARELAEASKIVERVARNPERETVWRIAEERGWRDQVI